MPELKATVAREITKESVIDAERLTVNGFPVLKPQDDPMQAGDFYFRPTYVERIAKPSWFLRLFGAKTKITHEAVTQLPKRLRVTDPHRCTLAEIGKRLGRKTLALEQVACVAKPETILVSRSVATMLIDVYMDGSSPHWRSAC
jgi:hypothetical protein